MERRLIWVGTIINGVLLGGLYGLFGVGLALVFGVTRIINIMHGEFIALPRLSRSELPRNCRTLIRCC